MKTLYRLYLSTKPITEKQKNERERASRFLEIPGVLAIKNSYRTVPDIIDKLEIESDHDIAERSIKNYVAEPGYHNVHLILTAAQWKKLNLRSSLYGQYKMVGGQFVTYGAWTGRADFLRRYSKDIRKVFTETTLGEWHELDHGLRELFHIQIPTTHAAFYGFAAQNAYKSDARRWVRKPYPHEAWLTLPFERLTDLTPKRAIFSQIISLLTSWLSTHEETITHPVENFKEYVTQAYGVPNKRYRLTGRHIGTDYATPIGTGVRAPRDGEMTHTGYTKTLGYFGIYRYMWRGRQYEDRYLHLKAEPRPGKRKQGDIIAWTGNSGEVTGPHIHIDVWRDEVKLDRINSRNWSQLTEDPQSHYVV